MNTHEDRVDRPLRERLERLELDLARERKANAALRDVALALGTPLDLDNMLELVLAKAADLLEADRATLYLIDDATGELVSRHVTGGTVSTIRLSVGDGIAGSVVKSGKTIRVRDAYKDKRFDRTWDLQTGYRTRAILAVPMKNHVGRTIGVLQVLNKRDGKEFSADDEGMLASLATQAAISIDNARLFLSVVQKNVQLRDAQQQLERKVAQLNLLFDLESAMARAGSEPELAEAVLRETVQAAQFSAGALLVSDPASELPILYWFRRGEGPLGSRPQSRPPADSLLARAMAGSPQLTPPAQDARPLAESSSLGFDVRSGVAVSLTSEEGAALGALGLYDPLDDRPLLDDDVELARLVAVNATTAVSLQRARDSRERTERLSTIGRLLSGVLHDLKTPMTVIAGYVQLLSMTEDPKLREEYTDLILRQFDHITAMQREVLAFARGERTLLLSKVYLSRYADELRAQIERELQGRPVKLEMNVNDRGIARFDEGKITRALHNLVRNAIEAMGPAGGTLTLGVDRDGDSIVFTVADTGPGIPKEIEGKLFESFVSQKPGGTGLGLAIVKKVVGEHGGSASVSSSSKGAVFHLRIPHGDTPRS